MSASRASQAGGAPQRARTMDASQVQPVLAAGMEIRERAGNVVDGALRGLVNGPLVESLSLDCFLRRRRSDGAVGNAGDANPGTLAHAVRSILQARGYAGDREARSALPHLLIRSTSRAGPANADL